MPRCRIVSHLFLMLSLVCLVACQPESSPREDGSAQVSAATYFPIQLEELRLYLQLALTESEQSRGLMFREQLAADHGMLFVFDQPGPRAFWMRNTRIKLDLAYLDKSGRIVEIHKLYPYSETPVPSRSQAVQFVIEMNRGWFQANQAGVGAQLDIEAVRKAIVARGKSPKTFGLE